MAIETLQLGRVDYATAMTSPCRLSPTTRTPTRLTSIGCVSTHRYSRKGWRARPEHVLNPGDIPVVQSNRGGQVTFHGPGQVVAYPLAGPATRGLLRERAGLPHRGSGAAHAGRLRRHRPPRGGRARHLRAAGRSPQPRPLPQRPQQRRRAPRQDLISPASARSPRWASRSAATAPTTAWR